MALVYKPNALYMSPKNESVDITSEITYSFMFKGYQMSKAVGQLYQNSNIGEWTPIGDPFDFDDGDAPFYNNSIVSQTYYYGEQQEPYDLAADNAGSTLGWGVTAYSMPSTQTALTNNKMIPALKGFETGNMVETYTGTNIITATPYNYTFISDYNSKLSLGSVNSGTDAEGTDLTNTFSVTEGVYINLTTGDAIQESISSTTYYIGKINEGASDPVGYYIKIFTTQAGAISGTGTVVTTAVANKTFYVNPTTTTTNIFYVGVIGGNNISLYTTKEAALQGVSEAIVPLTEGTSYVIRAFETSPVVQFIPTVVNEITFDLDDVYGYDREVELTFSEGTTYNYSYSGVLYTGQQLTCVNTNDNVITTYKYYIRVWSAGDDSGSLSLYQTRDAAQSNISALLTMLPSGGTNEIYLSEVLETTKLFRVTWLDNSNIPLISSWQAFLYNVNEDGTQTLIEQSDVQYNANIEYEFKHLLLSYLAGNVTGMYMVKFVAIDNTGYEYEGNLEFDVGYPVSATAQSPRANVNNCDSSISVEWDNIVSITGEASSDVSYIDNYLYSGNYGALLEGTSVTYNVNIPEANFPTFLFQPEPNFSGRIMYLDGESQSAELSYDSSINRFVFSITNKLLGTTVDIDVATDVEELDSTKVYLVGYAIIDSDKNSGVVYIREYGDSTYSW